MISYASIDRIENGQAVCELELIQTDESNSIDYFDKDTVMVDIPLTQIQSIATDVKEGDVIVVEHEDATVTKVCYKDDEEKKRRIELLKEIMG